MNDDVIERAMVRIIEWLAWVLGPIVRGLDWIGRGGGRQ